MKCKSCGAALDLTMLSCPACGAEVPLGRLTGLLGLVCRQCDAYNEPGARTCVSCGQPLGVEAPAPAAAPPAAAPAPPPRPPPPRPPGAPLVQSFPRPAAAGTRCPACGTESGGGPFCPSCGRSLSAPPPAPPATPPSAGAGAPAGTAMFVAVAQPSPRARLVLERGEAAPGSVFQLASDEVQAGRSQGAVIFPGDPCLAAHHATFLHRGGALVVRDEGAAGGIYVRIAAGQSAPLKAGSLFAVGDRLLRFAGPLPARPAAPPDGTVRLGAPRPDNGAVLLEEWLEGGVGGRVYLRSGPSITVGRAGCSVNLGDDPYLSQAHAEIALENGGATLRDLGSSNGTFLRIPPGGEATLRDGDELRIGREVLRVELR
ncbi:MAG: FHA domain-containing protein [Deltaproteobacteria bacterium]|nr:FHA domain-containing protein [Deltaproteobacteria bacterium]